MSRQMSFSLTSVFRTTSALGRYVRCVLSVQSLMCPAAQPSLSGAKPASPPLRRSPLRPHLRSLRPMPLSRRRKRLSNRRRRLSTQRGRLSPTLRRGEMHSSRRASRPGDFHDEYIHYRTLCVLRRAPPGSWSSKISNIKWDALDLCWAQPWKRALPEHAVGLRHWF